MTRTTLTAVLVAALVLLAGCTGGTAPTDSPTAEPTDTPTPTVVGSTPGDDTATRDDGGAADAGTLNFYVSDEKNAIGDFRHLNVTIDSVVLIRAEDGGEASTPTEEATPTNESTPANETMDAANTTETERDGEEPEDDESAENGRVTIDVNDQTVDLTQLLGANATLIGQFEIESGTYTKVFVHVSEVNATLTTGEHVRVKLPSEKLHLNKPFTVGANESVDFVFDIAVHKAGKSGKYILRPVIGESGTDVPIEDVGEDREDEDERNEERTDDEEKKQEEKKEQKERQDRTDETETAPLNATFVGNVSPGADATIEVTRNGTPVANATVTVNDEVVGTTDDDGRLTFSVPENATELTVEVEAGEDEAELEVEFDEPQEKSEEKRGEKGSGK